jgi:DNA-binding response OmpR family regulator
VYRPTSVSLDVDAYLSKPFELANLLAVTNRFATNAG